MYDNIKNSLTLLPCPFCDTKFDHTHGPRYVKNSDMWEGMIHEIYCMNCNLVMSDYSRKMVEAKWNFRKCMVL
jgi:hypothetical protein